MQLNLNFPQEQPWTQTETGEARSRYFEFEDLPEIFTPIASIRLDEYIDDFGRNLTMVSSLQITYFQKS
jgi:hypothetical protein